MDINTWSSTLATNLTLCVDSTQIKKKRNLDKGKKRKKKRKGYK